MTARIEFSEVVDRPLSKVFDFYARDHVRNHPRWDSDMQLEQITGGPMRVGTMIRRRNSRSGTPVEGTMEVVEFEPDRMLAMLIHDGPAVMSGRTTFEALGPNQTRITTLIELPGMDENMDKTFLLSRLQRSAQVRKALMEAELKPA